MMSRVLVCICLSIINRHVVEMASSGAKESACASMYPTHFAQEQDGAPPYELLLSSTKYNSFSNITVVLKSNDLAGFKGFLCQARQNVEEYITYGKLTPLGMVNMTNNCRQEASLTHTDAKRKTTVRFIWTAPAHDSGNITIICTIVQQFSIFWTNVTSPKIIFSNFNTELTTSGLSSAKPISTPPSTVSSRTSQSSQSSKSTQRSSTNKSTVESSTESSHSLSSTKDSFSNITDSTVSPERQTLSSGEISTFQSQNIFLFSFYVLSFVFFFN